VSDGELRMWNWTELPRFANDCRAICDAVGASYEDEFDLIRWRVIEENICRNPLAGQTRLDPRFDQNEQRRVFRTAYAPAQMTIPPIVVAYRVVSFPEFGRKGVIEGREVWLEDELRAIGYGVLANDS
jgi:hypothetical protein